MSDTVVSSSNEDEVVPCQLLVLISGVVGISGGSTTCQKRDRIGIGSQVANGREVVLVSMIHIATGMESAQSETISRSAPVMTTIIGMSGDPGR